MIKRDFFNKSTIFILNINIKKLIFIIDELNSEKIRKYKNLKIMHSLSALRFNLINMKKRTQKIINKQFLILQ